MGRPNSTVRVPTGAVRCRMARKSNSARGGTRTRTVFRPGRFKRPASAISPPGRARLHFTLPDRPFVEPLLPLARRFGKRLADRLHRWGMLDSLAPEAALEGPVDVGRKCDSLRELLRQDRWRRLQQVGHLPEQPPWPIRRLPNESNAGLHQNAAENETPAVKAPADEPHRLHLVRHQQKRAEKGPVDKMLKFPPVVPYRRA